MTAKNKSAKNKNKIKKIKKIKLLFTIVIKTKVKLDKLISKNGKNK
jgi:hypothetical protein